MSEKWTHANLKKLWKATRKTEDSDCLQGGKRCELDRPCTGVGRRLFAAHCFIVLNPYIVIVWSFKN